MSNQAIRGTYQDMPLDLPKGVFFFLPVTDIKAQGLLWEYAQRIKADNWDLSQDILKSLEEAGYKSFNPREAA